MLAGPESSIFDLPTSLSGSGFRRTVEGTRGDRRRAYLMLRGRSMLKTLTELLVLALWMPSTVMAQPSKVPADQVARTGILRSIPSSIERRQLFGRQGVRPATASATLTTPDAQQPPERSWAGRHPVALGAMIGAAGGALLGASLCWRQVCGDGHGPLLVAFGAGLGAGIGAGVGITISLARR